MKKRSRTPGPEGIDAEAELQIANRCVRYYERLWHERVAEGGPRKGAWALRQMRIARASAERLRSQVPARSVPRANPNPGDLELDLVAYARTLGNDLDR